MDSVFNFNNVSAINSKGGVIYTGQWANTNFSNCSFNECKSYDGGCYYSMGTSNVSFVDCWFNGSNATEGGIAYVSGNGKCVVNRSNFTNTCAYTYNGGMGGSFYLDSYAKLLVSSSNFINSTAVSGGIVYSNSNASVVLHNSSFINQSSNKSLSWPYGNGSGGVAYLLNNATLNITDCNFVNSNTTGNGSVICISGTRGIININNSNFINSNASGNGSVIFTNSTAVINVNNCSFENSVALFNGSVINSQASSNVSVVNSSFINGSAQRGGAIYLFTNSRLNVSNSIFKDNTAAVAGGALYVHNGGYVNAKNSNFTNNTVSGGVGGAIYTYGGNITENMFINNSAVNINVMGGSMILTSNLFDTTVNNAINSNADSVVNSNTYEYKLVINYTELQELIDNVENNGVLNLISHVERSNDETNVVIDKNITINANNHYINANDGEGFIINENNNVTINNTSIMGGNGVIIKNNANLTLNNVILTNNTANVNIIENNGNLTLNDLNISNNNVNKSLIYNNGINTNLTVNKTHITNNNVKDTLIYTNGYITLESNIIKDNSINSIESETNPVTNNVEAIIESITNKTTKINNTLVINVKLTSSISDINITSGRLILLDSEENILNVSEVKNNENASISYTFTQEGTKTYHILYDGFNVFVNDTSNDFNITVYNLTPKIVLDNVTGIINQTITLNMNITDNNDENVATGIIKVLDANNNLINTTNIVNGTASINLTFTSYYNNKLNIIYTDEEKYNDVNTTINALIKEKTTIELVDNITVKYNDNTTIIALLVSGDSKLINNEELTLNIGNTSVKSKTINGILVFNYTTSLDAGIYDFNITYDGNSYYNGSILTSKINITKLDSKIELNNINTRINKNVTITAHITTPQGESINEGSVIFYCDDEIIGTSDVTGGVASVNYTLTSAENKTIKAEYVNSTNYNTQATTSTFNVYQVTPRIIISPIYTEVNNNTTIEVYILSDDEVVNEGKIRIQANNLIDTSLDVINGSSKTIVTFNKSYDGLLNITFTNATTYSNTNTVTQLTVTKKSITINTTNINTTISTPITLKINITSNDNVNDGNIYIMDTNSKILANTTVKNNTALVNLTFNTTYNGVLIIKYNSSQIHETNTTLINVNISKITTKINNITYTAGPVGSNITIKVNVCDSNNKNVTTGYVRIIYNNNTVATSKISNGNATITTKFTKTNNTITVEYYDENKYTNTTSTKNIILNKTTATIKISSIKAFVGDNITLTANVTDSNSNKVNGGYVYFRINGTNIKDSKNNTIQAVVSNGVATATYTVPTTWTTNKTTFSAYYNGTNNTTTAISTNTTVNASLRKVNITFFTDSNTYYTGDTINIRVIVTNNGVLVNGGAVTLKFNGVTLRDANNKTIQLNVINGLATLSYKLPSNIGAGNYTFNVVFGGGVYDRYETTTKISILKSDIHVEVTPIIATSKNTTLSARIYNGYNNAITGTTRISIKINGATFINNQNITNGIIRFIIPSNFNQGLYNVTISVGENSYYKGTKIDTKLLKT